MPQIDDDFEDAKGHVCYRKCLPPNPLTTEQVAPVPNDGPDCWLLVLKDMGDRRHHGIEKYGNPVRPFNGRDPLVDAYQEALDLCVYLRQAIEERKNAADS